MSTDPPPGGTIEARLDQTRRRLLDLSRRNRLLNHRPGARSSIRIVDELPAEVFRILATTGKAMCFLSREEAPPESAELVQAEEEGAQQLTTAPQTSGEAEPARVTQPVPVAEPASTSPALPLAPIANNGVADRHKDDRLQTALEGPQLQTRLTYLAREARSALEEQGCNILYATFGVVHWKEPGERSPVCRAPLVFVPVDLKRPNAQTRYKVAPFDDEILLNPCLLELCRRQFKVELPPFDADGEPDLDQYFRLVREAIQGLEGWSLGPEIHVGLFSFAKLLMYRDLDPSTWPPTASVALHPLVRRLCGVEADLGDPGGPVPDPRALDRVAPSELFGVVDADSSQLAAILAARQGRSLVIEGPPGTGKSQTITNIVADCLAAGRTVLFVAEKAAALEVVKRRLDAVGLGDFALELHSRYSKRQAVLDELRRTLQTALPERPPVDGALDQLALSRDRLNDYVTQLHAPAGGLESSSYEAITRVVALESAPEAPCEIPELPLWTRRELLEARDRIDLLDRRLANVGDVVTHPWRGVQLETHGVETHQRIRARLQQLCAARPALDQAFAQLARFFEIAAPSTVAGAKTLLDASTLVLEAPCLPAAGLAGDVWTKQADELAAWLRKGEERQQLKKAWTAVFRPDAEEEFWEDVLERRRAHKESLLRFFRPSWYSDSRRIRDRLAPGARPDAAQEIRALQALVASARLSFELKRLADRFAPIFGTEWKGLDGDFALLSRHVRGLRELERLAQAGVVDRRVALDVVASPDRTALRALAAACQPPLADLRSSMEGWLAAIGSTDVQWLGGDWTRLPLPSIDERLAPLDGAFDRLADWIDFHGARLACQSSRTAPFLAWALGAEGAKARGRLADAFERQFYRLFCDHALAQAPALRSFSGEDHRALIQRFRAADAAWIHENRRRLVAMMKARQPDVERAAHRESRLGILKAEMRKKRSRVSLRKLLEATGDVVQAIKPCFMMSPISVAQYLAPGAHRFDVVIFDEASQVEPADGYGAIARGKQLVLIGDEKQLPPTDFFCKVDTESPDDESLEAAASDVESILSLGIVRLPESSHCSLRWHYRSRHESLIEFSNDRFYDGHLRVFPSSHWGRDQLGLVFRHVPGGVYMRGAGQHNPVEARAVARAVIAHARSSPELSLGVGAFSLSQQRAIEDELERLRRELADEALERFFDPGGREPFFTKNLETIQGDERDVVLLSVGYGRDGTGKLTMNFGPLNREGGWRRLNVLVSRARRRCVVFSSIRADDLDLSTTRARGVEALKDYLQFAEHGQAIERVRRAAEHPSPFEHAVGRALASQGHTIHARVGPAGFGVDLAVVDPDMPERYLLGIECDGETYRNAPTACDRDRLRAEILEGLGWNVERVFAPDWIRRGKTVLDRLTTTIDELRKRPRPEPVPAPQQLEPAVEPAAPAPREESPPEAGALAGRDDEAGDEVTVNGATPDGLAPYEAMGVRRMGDLEALANAPAWRLAEVVAELVQVEGPVHEDRVLHLVTACHDTRVTTRTRRAVRLAIDAAAAAGKVLRRGEFLWKPGDDPLRVRYRGGSCPVNRPELIPLEELTEAVRIVLRREFGLAREALVQSVLRLLGFRRSGPRLVAAAEAAVDQLLEEGAIKKDLQGILVIDRDQAPGAAAPPR